MAKLNIAIAMLNAGYWPTEMLKTPVKSQATCGCLRLSGSILDRLLVAVDLRRCRLQFLLVNLPVLRGVCVFHPGKRFEGLFEHLLGEVF